MKLKSLRLINFRAFKDYTFEPNGENVLIKGDNDTGKTTITDAYYWVLLGENAEGTPGFSPKPNDTTGENIHKLVTSVEAIFTFNDGLLTIKREMKEEWHTKRGEMESVMKGNTYEFFIDDIPLSKGEFDKRIIELIGDINSIKCATKPGYFMGSLDMKTRRSILFELANIENLSDYEIAKKNKDLSLLCAEMYNTGNNFYTCDEVKAKNKRLFGVSSDRLKKIPGLIDEATRAIPISINRNLTDIEKKLEKVQTEKARLETLLNCTKSEKSEMLKQRLEESKTKLAEARSAYVDTESIKRQKHIKHINDLKEKAQAKEFEINTVTYTLGVLGKDIEKLEQERNKLRDDYGIVKNFEYTGQTEWKGDTICPLCNQEIPIDSVEEQKTHFYNSLKEKKEAFNKEKAEKLENINTKGKGLTANIKTKKGEQSECSAKISTIQNEKIVIETKLGELENYISSTPFEQTSEYERLDQIIKGLEINLGSTEKIDVESTIELRSQIAKIQKSVDELSNEKATYMLAQKQKERVKELEDEEKRIAKECEHYKKVLYLCDEFIKFKVSMATETINDRFRNIRFKLFKEQINGGLEEICDAYVNTKSGYQSFLTGGANEAARINANLEIAGVLGKHYGVTLPIFLDGSESITKPIVPSDRQLVRMAVEAGVNELEITIEKNADEETA